MKLHGKKEIINISFKTVGFQTQFYETKILTLY
jgi:hypothetical protein